MSNPKLFKRQSTLSGFFRSIFHRSNSKVGGEKKAKKDKVQTGNKSAAATSGPVDFGIEDTTKLTHFQRAKPPPNRRRPAAMQQRSASKMSITSQKALAATPSELENQQPLSLALAQQFRNRSQTEGKLFQRPPSARRQDSMPAESVRVPDPVKVVAEKEIEAKEMSKSVPNLNEEEEEGEQNPAKTGSKRKRAKSFWQLIGRGSGGAKKREKKESGGSKKSAEEEVEEKENVTLENVEIRQKRTFVVRSESVGANNGHNFSTYRELIEAAHKSTPPRTDGVSSMT